MKEFWVYLVLLGAFLGIDGVWLSVVAADFYGGQLGDWLADEPDLRVAGLFYLIFVLALQVFVVRPGLDRSGVAGTLGRAFFFGFATCATYDLTNLATIEGWPWQVAAVDLVWGGVLSTLVTMVGLFVARRVGWDRPSKMG